MGAGALARAVDLLAQLGDDAAPPTVSELANSAGVPTSTAYRLLAELEHHGLVRREAGGTIALGTRMLALGRHAEAGLRAWLIDPAVAIMEQLAREHGETVILTAPCGLEAITLHVVESNRPVRLSYATYRRAPMHLGASGKVLAAYLERPDRERLVEALGDPALPAALEQIRARGYVITSDEIDDGATGIAAPLLDARGRLLAGLSLAGPTERMRAAGLDATVAAVRAAAGQIEARV
jgi:DNA-binding IclR family transcriptional regulator